MTDEKRALLGDHEAAKRLTEAGVLVPCSFYGGNFMSMYNMINGFNPACLLIMPMLGRKQEEWPRFRDCFVTNEKNIAIYTRVGGGNRGCGYGEEELYKDPNFITTYDDEYDSTYATYEFSVPERWKGDFDLIVSGKISEVSDEYVSYLKEFYPILAEKGVIDKVFRPSSAEEMEMLEGME